MKNKIFPILTLALVLASAGLVCAENPVQACNITNEYYGISFTWDNPYVHPIPFFPDPTTDPYHIICGGSGDDYPVMPVGDDINGTILNDTVGNTTVECVNYTGDDNTIIPPNTTLAVDSTTVANPTLTDNNPVVADEKYNTIGTLISSLLGGIISILIWFL